MADRVVTVASGLMMPNGVAFRDGDLYVAEINRVLRFDDVESNLESFPEPVVLNDDYRPNGPTVGSTLGSVLTGSSTFRSARHVNICDRTGEDSRFGTILRMNPDGTGEIFARGIRNSVGFDWQPGTNELWSRTTGGTVSAMKRRPTRSTMLQKPVCISGTPSVTAATSRIQSSTTGLAMNSDRRRENLDHTSHRSA